MEEWIEFFGLYLPAVLFGTAGNVVLRASKIATRNNEDTFWQGMISLVFGIIAAYGCKLCHAGETAGAVAALLVSLGGGRAAEMVQNFALYQINQKTKAADESPVTPPEKPQQP